MADVKNPRRDEFGMRAMYTIAVCVLLALNPTLPSASAQGWGPMPQTPSAEASDSTWERPAGSTEPASPAPEPAWERPAGPRILLLTARGLESTRGVLSETLSHVGTLTPHTHYMRAARRLGRRWSDDATFAGLLPAEDVDLVIVVERSGSRRAARLQMTYRDGHTGELLLESIHGRGGNFEGTARRILREAALVSRVVTESHAAQVEDAPTDEGVTSTPEESADVPPGADEMEEESRSTVGVRVLAGPGFGSAQAKILSDEGGLRLSVTRFAVVDAALLFDIVPSATAAHSFSLGVSYRTSVALSVRDARGDGIIRNAPARVQLFEGLGAVNVDHGPRLRSTIELGWTVRTFDSPAELSFPDYTMTGPLLRLSEGVSLWEDGLRASLGAELSYVASISKSLRSRGVDGSAWAVGWSGTLHLPLGEVLALQLAYREAQTFLPIANGNTGHTRERFVALRLHYRP